MTRRKKTSRRLPERGSEPLYREVRAVLDAARAGACRAVNAAMVEAYWQIGRRRAAYGQEVPEELSGRLSEDFGRGFDNPQPALMRQFYLAFPERPGSGRGH